MKKISLYLILLYFASYIVQRADTNSPCGGDNWVAFENESCFKLVTKSAGEQDEEACSRLGLVTDSSVPTVSPMHNFNFELVFRYHMYEFLTTENLLPMNDTMVLCEKNQTLSFDNVHETILKMQETITSIARLQTIQTVELYEAKMNISRLQNSPVPTVPIGYIYVQLPGQQGPHSIWNNLYWMDVSHEYAGLFFRTTGGGSEQFEVIQEENSPKLEQVNTVQIPPNKYVTVSTNGTWSAAVSTGAADIGSTDVWGLRFALSKGEVRPRNTAVRIWKRIY